MVKRWPWWSRVSVAAVSSTASDESKVAAPSGADPATPDPAWCAPADAGDRPSLDDLLRAGVPVDTEPSATSPRERVDRPMARCYRRPVHLARDEPRHMGRSACRSGQQLPLASR